VTDSHGETRTFLYSELSNISYPTVDPHPPVSTPVVSSRNVPGSAAAGPGPVAAGDSLIRLPEGTEIPVRNNGVLDACCLTDGAMSLGSIDADVKSADGKVLIPEGASVTMTTLHHSMVNGRVTLQFELGSADFNSRHYLVSSAKSALDEGAVVTFTGPAQGTPEAKVRGMWLHLDDHTYMGFKAATPTVFKLSQ